MPDPEPPADGTTPVSPSTMLTGRMPDITAAQIVAVVGAVITAAVAFGVNITKEQQIAILGLAGAVAAILLGADAHLRARRGQSEAIKHLADQHLQATRESLAAGHPPPDAPRVTQ